MSTEQLENAFSNFDEALTGRIRSIGTDFTAAEEKNIEERVKELLEQLKQHARLKGTVVEQTEAIRLYKLMSTRTSKQLNQARRDFAQYRSDNLAKVEEVKVGAEGQLDIINKEDEASSKEKEEVVDPVVALANEFDALHRTFLQTLSWKDFGVNDPKGVANKLKYGFSEHFKTIDRIAVTLPHLNVTAEQQLERMLQLEKEDKNVSDQLRAKLEETEKVSDKVKDSYQGIVDRRLGDIGYLS